jgi:hypothetical protein
MNLGPWHGTIMYPLPVFEGNLTVHRRFRADLTEADRVARFGPKFPDTLSAVDSDSFGGGPRNAKGTGEPDLRAVRSVRWKGAGVLALVVGCDSMAPLTLMMRMILLDILANYADANLSC